MENLAAHCFELRGLVLRNSGRCDLAGVGPEHRKQSYTNPVCDKNTDCKRRHYSANQHNRRKHTLSHETLALGYDTTNLHRYCRKNIVMGM